MDTNKKTAEKWWRRRYYVRYSLRTLLLVFLLGGPVLALACMSTERIVGWIERPNARGECRHALYQLNIKIEDWGYEFICGECGRSEFSAVPNFEPICCESYKRLHPFGSLRNQDY